MTYGPIQDMDDEVRPKIEDVGVVIVNHLFDRDKLEMITKIYRQEVDNFAIIKTLVMAENEHRLTYGNKKKNLMASLLNNNLLFRTSLDGWRAMQGEKILTSGPQMQQPEPEQSTKSRLTKILGGKQ